MPTMRNDQLHGTEEPLANSRVFSATSAEELHAMLQANNGASVVRVDGNGRNLAVIGNHCFLPHGELWFSRSSEQVIVNYPNDDVLRVRFWHSGTGATCRGRNTLQVAQGQAIASTAAAEVDFEAGFGQVCWRATKDRIEQKATALTGRPLGAALNIETALDLTKPAGGTLLSILSCMLQLANNADGRPLPIALGELEQAFIVGLLSAVAHDSQGRLDGPARGVAPWQVRRAEAYIEANWNRSITIEDLVDVTGTSARSLFRTFKENRGCTPLEFARGVRLEHARRMLENPDMDATVTLTATACGFGDPGHFAKEFLRAFGERPSVILARKRGMVAA
ncbi:MAG: helix-turn-helix transcriptional regulator [Rhodospirillaceae bacterium]|nr:helix-turn-helix transcriptional regulator [Rhodospirillaceae bacterium]